MKSDHPARRGLPRGASGFLAASWLPEMGSLIPFRHLKGGVAQGLPVAEALRVISLDMRYQYEIVTVT